MESQVLHTVWYNISGEAAVEIWYWSLWGVTGLTSWHNVNYFSRQVSVSCLQKDLLLPRRPESFCRDANLWRSPRHSAVKDLVRRGHNMGHLERKMPFYEDTVDEKRGSVAVPGEGHVPPVIRSDLSVNMKGEKKWSYWWAQVDLSTHCV